MYNRQRPHLHFGGENLKYYLTPPPPPPEQLRKVKVIGEMALLYKKRKNACGVIDTACKI
jgi:hypothetical protein